MTRLLHLLNDAGPGVFLLVLTHSSGICDDPVSGAAKALSAGDFPADLPADRRHPSPLTRLDASAAYDLPGDLTAFRRDPTKVTSLDVTPPPHRSDPTKVTGLNVFGTESRQMVTWHRRRPVEGGVMRTSGISEQVGEVPLKITSELVITFQLEQHLHGSGLTLQPVTRLQLSVACDGAADLPSNNLIKPVKSDVDVPHRQFSNGPRAPVNHKMLRSSVS
jgi:hypothetical protein